MEELRKETERKHSHLGVPERGGREGRYGGRKAEIQRLRITREVGEKVT